VVKVSWNAPEHHSGAPKCQYPHQNGRSGTAVMQFAYNYYILGYGRVQNLEAVGLLGSLLHSTDGEGLPRLHQELQPS